MVTNMLKAISQMLIQEPKETSSMAEFAQRVKCAKIMLDEIIQGMIGNKTETTTSTQVTFNKDKPQAQAQSPLVKELEPKEPEYTIEVEPGTKALKWMERNGHSIPLTQLLLVDGKQVTYEKAIGMIFKQIKVVEE